MKAKTLGVIAVGQLAGNAAEDYVTPMISGYIPAVAGISGATITNVGLGAIGLYVAAGKIKASDDVKLASAIFGTRLLTDVVYDMVKGYLPTGGASIRRSGVVRVVQPVSSYSGGMVQVD